MNTPDIRRAVLRTLIDRDFGGVARRLALHLGKPDGQINDMLADPPRKSFGERIARAIEDAYPLPLGYLDQAINATPANQANEPAPASYKTQARYSKQAMALAAYYDRLPSDKKAEIEASMVAICLSIPEEKRSELAEILTLFQ